MTKLTSTLGAICLSLLLLFSVFMLMMDFKPFYAYEIEKNNISEGTGIPQEELLPLYLVLTDYMKGTVPSIQMDATVHGEVMPMYNQREIDHMVDVKGLIDLLKYTMSALVVIVIGCGTYLFKKKGHYYPVLYGQFFATLGIFALFIFMALTDFNAYFIKFHELFFTNDLWLLNPKTDRMIQLLPEVFFRDIVVLIVWAYGLVSLMLGYAGNVLKRTHNEG